MGTALLGKNIDQNIELLKAQVHHTDDISIRCVKLPSKQRVALLYIRGLICGDSITRQVLDPLLQQDPTTHSIAFLQESVLTAGKVRTLRQIQECIGALLDGEALLLLERSNEALGIDLHNPERRSISSPQTEAVIRGPRDSFVEHLATNQILIRRRLKDPNLVYKTITLGVRSRSKVTIAHVEGVADKTLLERVHKRLSNIDIDIVLDSGYVEQLIEDAWWSPFSTVQDTERPDEVVAALSEGRIALLVDNTPFALIVPGTFISQMQSPEDHYLRWPIVNFVRIIRLAALVISVITPALYVTLVAFHPEMIPTQLALSITVAREGIPFPSFLEALIMELSLELLREAGIRLPSPIGQTIGIVGGIIIGDAAVRANLVSPVMVIVVAVTAIAGFVLPAYTFGVGIRMLRFFLILAASLFGLYGLSLGLLLILGHLCSLSSFGVSYLAPLAPVYLGDWKDALIRGPLHLFKKRPRYLRPYDQVRQGKGKRR